MVVIILCTTFYSFYNISYNEITQFKNKNYLKKQIDKTKNLVGIKIKINFISIINIIYKLKLHALRYFSLLIFNSI